MFQTLPTWGSRASLTISDVKLLIEYRRMLFQNRFVSSMIYGAQSLDSAPSLCVITFFLDLLRSTIPKLRRSLCNGEWVWIHQSAVWEAGRRYHAASLLCFCAKSFLLYKQFAFPCIFLLIEAESDRAKGCISCPLVDEKDVHFSHFICAICQDFPLQPSVLTCGHYFCSGGLKSLPHPKCPTCNKRIPYCHGSMIVDHVPGQFCLLMGLNILFFTSSIS